MPLIYNLVKKVFPLVDGQLGLWKVQCGLAEDDVLRSQAAASITGKRFHCQGGSVFSLYPNTELDSTVRFIVAFQTISDYLDNLCDRAGVYDEQAFRQLHLSMLDAVDPSQPCSDYYLLYPHKEDGGYLNSLVSECRKQIRQFRSYGLVRDEIKRLVVLYSDLQSFKHIEPELREKRLMDWANEHLTKYPGLSCWEFCAAAGSTLGVFMLIAAAQAHNLCQEDVEALISAYMPWVCGLHILLDYYIDAVEDRLEGDFNFTSYYASPEECGERLGFFVEKSLSACATLQYPKFHETLIIGLLALYLSDTKAGGGLWPVSRRVLRHGSGMAKLCHGICRILRSMGKL